MPVAPATIVRTNASWPGTSTTPSVPTQERERREAEIDRDAPSLLLGQPVGIDAGERAHERGLAVIDVARGAEDHGPPPAHQLSPPRARMAPHADGRR